MYEVNIPEVVAEVTRIHDRYEKALGDNDVATLNELFWNSPHTTRFGIAEILYGYDAIASYRSGRTAPSVRVPSNCKVTTFGRDVAVAHTEFRRPPGTKIGRQMQTWVRTAEGWRIVAAHVSFQAAEG
ncbi:MAG: oxalurate catabolism protein HpxZ [Alphaproteobacteria bacterium]|nr:oxalurate catabolism protein HpxZ [Alphaproteobacteria bacterium]